MNIKPRLKQVLYCIESAKEFWGDDKYKFRLELKAEHSNVNKLTLSETLEGKQNDRNLHEIKIIEFSRNDKPKDLTAFYAPFLELTMANDKESLQGRYLQITQDQNEILFIGSYDIEDLQDLWRACK